MNSSGRILPPMVEPQAVLVSAALPYISATEELPPLLDGSEPDVLDPAEVNTPYHDTEPA